MFDRIAKTLHLPAAGLASLLILTTAPAPAQAPPPIAPAQFDPAEVFFQGYLARRSAEELEAKGDYLGALAKLESARKLIEAVARYYPGWKPEMVSDRSAKTVKSIAEIGPKAFEQRKKNESIVAELEGGVRAPGTLIDPAEGVVPLTPGILEVDPLATRRLAEAEAEVKRLRQAAQASPTADAESSRNESRLRDIARQRDLAEAQLNAAEANVQALRSRLAASPVENEMKALNQRIAGLEQEREAMGMALNQSRSEHTEALSRIAILQADRNVMRQKFSDLDRDLKAEREVANSVVAGQRTQLRALEKELERKDVELGKANERISSLVNELQESRDAFSQLRGEQDLLLQERAQMSALLELNKDGRIQDLIQQNMGLAKNLREANEKVERLNLDNNSAKDDITEAKRDLAIAKYQINSLQEEKRKQDQRLAELEKRLRNEEAALENGQVAANPEEVAMLREIIRKQLAIQERRRQARDLLVEAAGQMGTQDEKLAQAVKLFDSQEIVLSPEEQRLIADNEVDGEFVSPFAQDRATVGRNTSELNRDISIYERTAEKSFSAGRYLPTRELFEMIIEQHPGHVPALCKLGIVNLKLDDPAAAVDNFRRAVELEANNPYAHRMLGYTFMTLGDLAAAEQNARKAVDLAIGDAKNHALMGAITYRLGRAGEAESHYKAAISADPMPSDPYFNLALIVSRTKRLDQARDYYQQALERGALPNPTLEQRLAQP